MTPTRREINITNYYSYPYPKHIKAPNHVEREEYDFKVCECKLVCPKCNHRECDHFDGSYNDNAKRGDYSECGVELQFVCGCHSTEFVLKEDEG